MEVKNCPNQKKKLSEEKIEQIYQRFPHYKRIAEENNMIGIFETIMEEAYFVGYHDCVRDTIN